jgi:NAD+ kinase
MHKVVLLSAGDRPGVAAAVQEVRAVIEPLAEIVAHLQADVDPLPDELAVDLAVVVGGDGTLISQARRIVDLGWPLVGINVGRLGFLAAFDAPSLRDHARLIFAEDPPITEQIVLHSAVGAEGGAIRDESVAVNDCVITSGPPFRMIELHLSIDGAEGPTLIGDGVIVATPTGSTAYNVSAGGPIVHPSVEAIVITPLAAHSLAFRPIVLHADSTLQVRIIRGNPGTALIYDGQVATTLAPDEVVTIRRHDRKARFVGHPETSYWSVLLDKMRWAAPPSYRDRGG